MKWKQTDRRDTIDRIIPLANAVWFSEKYSTVAVWLFRQTQEVAATATLVVRARSESFNRNDISDAHNCIITGS